MNILLEEPESNLTAAQVALCASLLAVVDSSMIHPQGEIKFLKNREKKENSFW